MLSVKCCFSCSFECFKNSVKTGLLPYKLKYDPLLSGPFLQSASSAANDCYGINLSWYPVLSKFAIYKFKQWRVWVDSLYQKSLILTNICWSYLQILQASGIFWMTVYLHAWWHACSVRGIFRLLRCRLLSCFCHIFVTQFMCCLKLRTVCAVDSQMMKLSASQHLLKNPKYAIIFSVTCRLCSELNVLECWLGCNFHLLICYGDCEVAVIYCHFCRFDGFWHSWSGCLISKKSHMPVLCKRFLDSERVYFIIL